MWLGMALVVGIMAILLTGTLKGMDGYRRALSIVDCKLAELDRAVALSDAISLLEKSPDDQFSQAKYLRDLVVDKVRPALDKYHESLQYTIDRKRADDEGYRELEQYQAIKTTLDGFEAALREDVDRVSVGETNSNLTSPTKKTGQLIARIRIATQDLISNLNTEMHDRTAQSKRDQRISLVILVASSLAAVVCMIGTLRFFYRRLLKPIRLLEQGVTRVARGDFEHRIDIRSGDEIESFANAYNEMAGKLHELYRDLAQQVNERSRQLVRSERMAGVGFLAAGVAHEINNPLASIAFCSEALESRLGELFETKQAGRAVVVQDREIVQKYLKMIQEEAFRCKEITQKLLAFSRGGDRKRELTNLNDVIQGVLDIVQHVPNSKGKTILFQPAANLDAWVNGQEVKQVFLNLVVNALDSMDEGGTLTIRHAHRGDSLELSFQDTGCGMTPDILENIFEPFFTRSRTGKGTGLGLSISHRIITQHGGEIEATSAGLGQGSTFVVRLPTSAPAEATGDSSEGLDPREEFLRLSEARQQRQAA
jgi:signal transduction histidine kinase